jgi:hypothetical protein
VCLHQLLLLLLLPQAGEGLQLHLLLLLPLLLLLLLPLHLLGLHPLLLLLLSQAGEGLQLLDWSVSAKAQLKSWLGYDLVAPRVRVYFKASENNWKVRLQ